MNSRKAKAVALLLLLILFLAGCGTREGMDYDAGPNFKDIYKALLFDEEKLEFDVKKERKKVTISVKDERLDEFLKSIGGETSISIICDADLDDRPVTIDVVDTDVYDLLSAVARRFDADVVSQGDLFFIGNLKENDRGFLVRKVRRLTASDIKDVLSSLTSELGRVFVSEDGLVVVGDSVKILKRINSMLDDVEKQPASTWILQMYLITTSDKENRDLGFDSTAELDISAAFADSGMSREWRRVADGEFRAVLNAARSSSRYGVIAEPMMLMVDGGESKIQDGEKIPIPLKTVSDSGTVSTTGYEYVDTGIIIAAEIREMSHSTARCRLNVEITNVVGYVETAPISQGQSFSSTTILESGGTYLVGSITKKQLSREKYGAFFPTGKKKSEQDVTIHIWLRCHRIHGPYNEGNETAKQ